jgi:hypothetical protein
MPDRELTTEETQRLIEETEKGELRIEALRILSEEKTKQTLHDLCLHELSGKIEALKQFVILYGVEINILKKRLEQLEGSH